MLHEIVSAGFGGQGVLLLGQTLAYAGMLEGMEVSWYPSYGPEMRGGTANCTTVISSGLIGSPVVSNPSALVAMNRPSLEKFLGTVKPGGVVIYDQTLYKSEPVALRPEVTMIGVEAQKIANELGSTKVANIVLLGALIEIVQPVSVTAVQEALKMILPVRRHNLLPLNYAALQKGAEVVA